MSIEATEGLSAKESQQLATALSAAVRTASYYDPGNAVLTQATKELLSLLTAAGAEEGSVSFSVLSHCVFVNKSRVPTSLSTYSRFASLTELFKEWGISTLAFDAGITEPELQDALLLLSRTRPAETESLSQMLVDRKMTKVHADTADLGTGSDERRSMPLLTYSAAMHLGGELNEATGVFQPNMIRRVRHMTQNVVDEILRDPTTLLTLTTIKDFDRYLILHSTNVAVLSAILGQRLGLDKATLGELCLAGFLHDAGKLGVDPDVLNKPGKLEPHEWESMRQHPVMAANSLLGGQRLTSSMMRSVVVAFEHHMNFDLSGYPPVHAKDSITMFGGIVSLADRFDALTTARVYRKVNLTPPEAVVILLRGSGTDFDPVLAKLFVEVMGLYPTGSVVVLGSGEAGVVCKPPSIGTSLDRPQVRLIIGENPGEVVDLQERVRGRFKRSIIGVLNPSNRGQIPAVDPSILYDMG